MAVPKKKISRSRRNMRRHSCAYQIDPVAYTTGLDGALVRTHTVTLENVAQYVEARTAAKAARKAATNNAK
ncbi:MAG: 50S ribosomal protein L32 [Cryobacterium sp.]|nr:50S ribosomal protein L32 [Oligoflexia bacterium]